MIILFWLGKSWSIVCIVYFNTVPRFNKYSTLHKTMSLVDMKIWVNVFLFLYMLINEEDESRCRCYELKINL